MIKRKLNLKTDIVVDGKKYLLSTVSFDWVDEAIRDFMGYSYETMLFLYKDNNEVNYRDLYCERYDIKEDAVQHHHELVERLKNGEKIWE